MPEFNEKVDIIKEAINLIPEDIGGILTLRHIQKISYNEISKMLDLPVEAVKARVARGELILEKAIAQIKEKESNVEQTDEELIKKFQEGDKKAYKELVLRYKDRLLIYVDRFMLDLSVSEDLVQDTLMKLYTHGHTYKPLAKFSTWIYTIAGNIAKTELRKRNRRKTYSFTQLSSPDNEFTPDRKEFVDNADNSPRVDIEEKKDILSRAMDLLPQDFSVILTMRDFQELSYDDISTILGLSLGTVKSRINRARIKLRETYKELENKK